MHELMIRCDNELLFPTVLDEITLESDWQVSPSKLSFKVPNMKGLTIREGQHVSLKAGGVNLFYGFIFSLDYQQDDITITAYDQMRYLKNKDSMIFTNLDAAGIIKKIASAFNLKTGTLEATGYTLQPRVEQDACLADMIKNALDQTLMNTNIKFILYDDYGALTLKNMENMNLDLIIDGNTISDFQMSSSIDQNTYNIIKLYQENEKTNKRDIYMAKDSKHINEWGALQFYERLESKENGVAKADALLKLYNQKQRTYSAKSVIGHTSVRPGTRVIVVLQLGEISLKNYMVVEKVKHKFQDSVHLMDLELIGRGN